MEPLPATTESARPARLIMAVAAAILVAMFALESRGILAALAAPRPVTPADGTGPLVKGSDCMGYYAWLRSALIDGDFHFDDEFAPTFASVPGSDVALRMTPTGHRANPWPVGPAIVWAPAVGAAHLALTGLGGHSPWPADGYSPPYQLAVGGTTLGLALLTLGLTYRIGRRFAGPAAAAAAAAVVVLGTPIVAYGTVEVSIAHGPATATLATYVFVWLRTFASTRLVRWVGVGGLLGLSCLMRWQLATFAVLPVLEAVWLVFRADGWMPRVRVAAELVAAGVASWVAFLPQVAVKQIVYGSPLGGLHRTAQNWLDPSLWAVLASTDRGLFYWTPVTFPALVGLIYVARPGGPRAVPGAILAAAVGVQIYTVAALLGGEAYLGWSFGFRFLTETCVLLAPGAAALFARANPGSARVLAAAGGVLVGWNLLLLGVYRHCVGGMLGGDPLAVVSMVGRYVLLRPLEGLGVVLAVGGLTFVLVRAFRGDRVRVMTAPVIEPPWRLAA
ncbi:MAG: hypothetical protein JWO38_2652 [Gemmataceae bacterium]|nr:hypothetical protein [Gemmataceae bacterium]